jgi:hypothetical protein
VAARVRGERDVVLIGQFGSRPTALHRLRVFAE